MNIKTIRTRSYATGSFFAGQGKGKATASLLVKNVLAGQGKEEATVKTPKKINLGVFAGQGSSLATFAL